MLHIGVSASLFTPPSPGLNQADNFSVRFYGSIVPTTTASYRLWTNSDDGVILWWYSGGTWQKLIDNPNTYVGQAYTNYFTLTAGQRYPIVLDYFEIGGNANIQLQWQLSTSSSVVTIPQANLSTSIAVNLPDIPGDGVCSGVAPAPGLAIALAPTCQLGNGLNVELHRNATVSDPSNLVHSVSVVDFNWGSGKPVLSGLTLPANFPRDNFALRFYGSIFLPTTGSYTFHTDSDDGIIVWIYDINGWRKIIDKPYIFAGLQSGSSGTLSQGLYPIVIDYLEYTGNAYVNFKWTTPNTTPIALVPQNNLYTQFPNDLLLPPPPYRIQIANSNYGLLEWTTNERTAILTGIDNAAQALQYLTSDPNRPRQSTFNTVMVATGVEHALWFIKANSTTSTISGPEPDVTFTYVDHTDQSRSVTYDDINNGNCKSFASSTFNGVFRPQAIVCNNTPGYSEYTTVHELGHQFDYRSGTALSQGIDGGFSLGSCITSEFSPAGQYSIIGSLNGNWRRIQRGWGSGPYPSNFQQSPEMTSPLEASADMFLNWVYRRNSATGSSPNIQFNTNGGAASGACVPTSNQNGQFPSQPWNGFKNINWTTPTVPVNDWGLPGDVMQAYMNNRMQTIMSSNGW
jgi:hypothetical protein